MSSTDSGDGDGTASSQNPVVSMPLTVVGVLDASTNNYDAFSSGVVMSLEDMDTLQAKIDGKTNTTSRTKTNYDQVVVHAQNIKDVPGIEAQIKMSGYQTTSFEQTRKEIEKQSRGIQLALGGIGCGNANVGKEYLAYLYGLRECPHYWLDQNRFEPVDGRRW